MLRFIDIDTETNTTIERFGLDNGHLWVAKRTENSTTQYGVSVTKKAAIRDIGKKYADAIIPPTILMPGTQITYDKYGTIYSIPGATKFLNCLLSFELKQQYTFYTVYCIETETVSLIVKPTLNPNKDCFTLSTSGGYIPDQIRRCIYQLYIEYDKGIELDLKIDKRNSKLREWLKFWYDKLPHKGLHS